MQVPKTNNLGILRNSILALVYCREIIPYFFFAKLGRPDYYCRPFDPIV
jgi:hypothetical protein